MPKTTALETTPEVQRFCAFLRINTVSRPSPDYAAAARFVQHHALESWGLPAPTVVELVEGKPIVLFKIAGTDPALPSVLLNGHMDVVPAVDELWDTDPFAAAIVDGAVYARGAQDMKCVCMQYLEAMARLCKRGFRPLRTVYISLVPDEEIGGKAGMQEFVKSELFRDMNVGVALDEGLANPSERFTIFYSERGVNWVDFTATGNAGHGSRFVEGTAVEKLMRVVNQALDYRRGQKERLERECECGKRLGDVVTLNVTMLRSGVAHNVIPTEATASMDIRVPPSVDMAEFERMLDGWAAEEGVSYKFVEHTPKIGISDVSEDSFWFRPFRDSLTRQGLELDLEVFPAATDSRFIRLLGIPCFGFSPMNNTEILLHDHNEKLGLDVYMRGIEIYERLIEDLSNHPAPAGL